VVAPDQIRTVIREFRDKLFTEIFPGRTEVPKTLVFARDDSHADDIVQIVREEFGKGNEFCQKITYRTGRVRVSRQVTREDGNHSDRDRLGENGRQIGWDPRPFPNRLQPANRRHRGHDRHGTDVRPLEILFFCGMCRSLNYFEQMKGRGVRIISPDDLRGVTARCPKPRTAL